MTRRDFGLGPKSLRIIWYVQEIENKLNNRPRKRYGFKTPNEVFLQKMKNSA